MKLRTIGYALLIAVVAVAFAIGSATTGEAKGRKKAAAAAPAADNGMVPIRSGRSRCAP